MDAKRPGPLKIGDKFLGKYEVRGLLGKGGYAFVYECLDPFLGRVVALKVIKVSQDGPTDVAKRARQEAQVLLRIEHPRLVKLFDAGVHDGLVYLVMEKLEGRTLREVLREHGHLSPAEALTVAVQVAQGVVAAHQLGVIHRDLKPENIFIQADNEVKVLDFGIAKVLGQGADTTQRDAIQGTVLYMSPEHLQGFGVTPRSDVFALGTVTFEMLFRHPLYLGEGPPGIKEAAWMQMSMMPPLLNELDGRIPHYIARVVHRTILRMAEQRYATMQEVEAAFMGALKRHWHEDEPKGGFLLRPLNKPFVAEAKSPTSDAKAKPLGSETLRAAQVLTSQVTVKAPHVPTGDTEPMSKQPFSAPSRFVPLITPATPQPLARDDRTPLMVSTVERPSSEKPTILAIRRSSPPAPADATALSAPAHSPTVPSVRPSSAQPHAAAAHGRVASLMPPNTAPPVTARSAGRAQLAPPPFFKDRTIRLAAAAAVVVGVMGGTSYGLLSPNAAEAPSAGAALIAPAEPASEAPARGQAAGEPAPAQPLPAPADTVTNAPVSGSVASAQAAATSPTPPATPASSLTPSPSAQAIAAKAPSKKPPSASALDAELEQRLQWLDGEGVKPKPSPKPSAPRTRETPF